MKKHTLILLFTVSSISLAYSQWAQIGSDVYGEAAGYYSGFSISLSSDGSIVAIGGHHDDGGISNPLNTGRVRILEDVAGTWTQIGEDIVDGFGFWDSQNPGSLSLSADGSIVAIGVPLANSGFGLTRVYENVAGTWTQIGVDIDGEAVNDLSGNSVSLSDNGSILAIGAPKNGAGDSGHTRVYENVGGTWIQIGQDIDGEANDDKSGFSVSLSADGSIVAIGAPENDDNGYNSGHVRVYKNLGGTWVLIGQDIDGESGFNASYSGYSVSLSVDGSIVAIGARYNDGSGGMASGHVRVYQNVGETWIQIGQDIDGESAGDQSGRSVSLSADGSVVAIGAPYNDGNADNSGHVRVYENVGGTWTQVEVDIDGDVSWDLIGLSIGLSDDGSKIAIGEPYNDGNGDQSGRVRVYETSTLSVGTFSLQDLEIYPNPVNSSLLIKSKVYFESIVIYDFNGRQLKSINLRVSSLEHQLDVIDLSSGMYFIELQSGKSKQVKKFIKK